MVKPEKFDHLHLVYHFTVPSKVASFIFLLVCFVCLKESTFEIRKNVFYFTLKALFVLDNQILTFQIFKFYDVIKCVSMKHETHFSE